MFAHFSTFAQAVASILKSTFDFIARRIFPKFNNYENTLGGLQKTVIINLSETTYLTIRNKNNFGLKQLWINPVDVIKDQLSDFQYP